MQLCAMSPLLRKQLFDTTSALSSRSDRCRQSTAQTLRLSVVRGHLRNWASAIAPSPCGARKPKDCCHRRRESSSGLFACWRKETDGRSADPASAGQQPEHTGHRTRAACPSRQWLRRCAWPRPGPARATPAAESNRATPRCRAPQSTAATPPHRSPARPRCEGRERAPPEAARSAPCSPRASRPSVLHGPRRSRPEPSPREIPQPACATHPAYARSTHEPRKTPCAPARSARTPKPDAPPPPGSADESPYPLRLPSCLNFNTDRKPTEEWPCPNGYGDPAHSVVSSGETQRAAPK